MHPILFHLFGYPVKTYGVFVSLAHVAGIIGVLSLARRRGHGLEPFVDLIFVVLFAGLLGGRLGYWAEHRHEIAGLGDFFRLDRGGLSFFGGLALAFPAYLLFLRRRGFGIWQTSDLLAPVLPFSLAVLRLGCFSAGCCYGLPTSLPWGVMPDTSPGVHLHPSPLYESFFLFALAGFLLYLNARGRWAAGLVACFCMGAYGLFRFFADFLRGDMERWLPLGLSSSQVLGILLFVFALAAARMARKARW